MSVELTCCVCGIQFSVPGGWLNSRQKDLRTFYCPNGHAQFFTKSVADRLREEKDLLARIMQAKLNDSEHARLVAERERDKAIKEKRKVERRIAHGVCPCCNHAFTDIAQHMVTTHPEFRLPEGKKPKLLKAAE